MTNTRILNVSFVFLLVIYNFFFWKENLGINIFLFSGMLLLLMKIAYPESFSSGPVRITLVGTLVTGLMVFLIGSEASKVAHIISLLLIAAFVHGNKMRSILFATLHLARHVVNLPVQFLRKKEALLNQRPFTKFLVRFIRLSMIPIFISFVFCLIYSGANPVFGEYAGKIYTMMESLFGDFIRSISFSRIFFLLFGALLIAGIVFRGEVSIFMMKDLSFNDKLERIKAGRKRKYVPVSSLTKEPVYPPSSPRFKSIALKNENRSGIILLCIVNAMLLLENLIDIRFLWFGFVVPDEFSLKAYVHEGTGLLIFSILLSISVLLYFFRRNQNFYPRNKVLRLLAFAWIIQNGILVISVFLRTYHYIDFHGLAYRRIGVDVFLLVTLIGLATLFIKIQKLKSSYFLLRLNTWSVYGAIVLLSLFNWDGWIAKYNLSHWNKGEVDIDFYLKLSPKVYPILYSHLAEIKAQMEAHKKNKVIWVRSLDIEQFKAELDYRRDKFLKEYSSHSWLSFNLEDYKAYQSLNTEGKELVEANY